MKRQKDVRAVWLHASLGFRRLEDLPLVLVVPAPEGHDHKTDALVHLLQCQQGKKVQED
jgi:hypothetical protein